ncbi:VWA domain-containing protein [Paenarthrobacter sp. NPDC089322]|uniref:VWA domain-containing protein n=1 Tax=Paenarthrobacter sp. NPDC089322 TaxID=3155065 RepID=UPI0034362A76
MRRRPRMFTFVVTAALLCLTTALPATATTPSPPVPAVPATEKPYRPAGRDVLILLDTSGSMEDHDNKDVAKIAAAKGAILEQIKHVPLDARIGLMTYPSATTRPTANCPSAKLQLPVSNSSITSMGSTLATLPKPDGGTPTSQAMLDAAAYLRSEGLTEVTIVLVSDGESNCGDNPCETAKKLKSENINVIVNTVGFDISTSGQSELECVAQASGGRYASAQNSDDIKQVIQNQLGNGLSLEIAAPAGTIPMFEESFSVGVTVSVAAGHSAAGVQLQITDKDSTSGSTVQRPVMSLGNLGSGASIPTRWLIRPPTNPLLNKTTYQVVLKSNGRIAVTRDFDIFFDHDYTTGANLSGTLQDFKNVVVLGDSYSSGEGAGTPDRPYFLVGDQAEKCHRTKNQYANWLFSPERVRILACSGATTLNVYRQGQHGEPSQLDQLRTILDTGYRPDAIFLSITGNDIGFGHIAKSCAISALTAAPTAPTSGGDPLASCSASPKSGESYLAVQELVRSVPGYMFTVLKHTSQVFEQRGIPTPPIIVLKYPELLARNTNTPLRCDGTQPFQTGALAAAYGPFAKLQKQLNEAVDEGVAYAVRHFKTPAYTTTTDRAVPPAHNMCSADPWFVPLTFKGVTSPEALHPNVQGHQAMAAAINSWAAREGDKLKPATTSVGVDAWWKKATVQWWPTESNIYVDLNQPEQSAVPTVKDAYGRTVIHVSGGEALSGTTIYVKSKPLVLGSVQLDSDGKGTLTIDLQATDLPAGNHTINVLGTTSEGRPVVATVPITLEQPFPLPFWGIALLALVLGFFGWRILKQLSATKKQRIPDTIASR